MILEANGKKYKVWWKHSRDSILEISLREAFLKINPTLPIDQLILICKEQAQKLRQSFRIQKYNRKRSSICHIQEYTDEPGKTTGPVYSGITECSLEDVFSKRKGRKLSFTHALEGFLAEHGKDKVATLDIWNQYKKQIPRDFSF
jgi:hypothetical protein